MFLYVKIFIISLYYYLMSISANCSSRFLPTLKILTMWPAWWIPWSFRPFLAKIVMLFLCKLKLDDHWTFQQNNDPHIHPNLPKLAQITPAVSSFTSLWKYLVRIEESSGTETNRYLRNDLRFQQRVITSSAMFIGGY